MEKQLAPATNDHGLERRRRGARLDEVNRTIDSVIDLMADPAATSADHRDLVKDRLGRFGGECQEIEGRLRQLEQVPARVPNPDALVDAILAGLEDTRKLFAHGTMEERKRVIRAFVENLTVDGVAATGELRTKRIPDAIPLGGIRDSFKVVPGLVAKSNRQSGRGRSR